jgi:hypothetical protein
MEATINEFYTKLKQVPAFLLLGRHYLGLETRTDPFLAEILWKYGRRGEEKTSYHDMLDGDATHFVDAALAWNDRRHVAVALARRLPEAVTPLGVLAIAGYTGDLDWLSLADLLPIVNRLNPR